MLTESEAENNREKISNKRSRRRRSLHTLSNLEGLCSEIMEKGVCFLLQ